MAVIASAGSGNWSSTVANTPWPSGTVPIEGDTVTIANTHTVTIDQNITIGDDTTTAAIQVASGGVLQATNAVAADYTLTAKGDIKVAGTFSMGTSAAPIPNTRIFTLKLNYSATLLDGEFGLIIQAGGTFNGQGATDRITVDRSLLTTDVGGYCSTAGTAVTRLQGQTFTGWSTAAGRFVINGTAYTVSSVTDADHIVLTATAGTQTAVSYVDSTADDLVTADSTGWLSGD